MKKQLYTITAMMALVVIAGISSASGQTSGSPSLTASVPFAFNVANKELPAGEYIVTCTNPFSSVKVLQIISKDGSAGVLVQTNSAIGKIKNNARLVFRRYENHYFLAQAWMPWDNIGMALQKSEAEKNTERNLAGREIKRMTVAIALKR